MKGDARSTRSSTYRSDLPALVEREHGPAEALGLPPFAALHPAIERLRTALVGVGSERTEISLRACARRLEGGRPSVRFGATVRLVIRGPHTLSPVQWQMGGVAVDPDAWAEDLAATLPHELRAVEQGHALGEPWTGTVVLDPWVAALLVHECVGHTSEADNYLDYVRPAGASPEEARPDGPALGHRWTHAALTVIDDPTLPDRIGSYVVDDEGRPAAPTVVVDRGVWTGLLHDRTSAATMSALRSGNGRRVVGASTVMPRMSVLTALPGDHALEHLLGEIDDGWYCSGSWGAGSMGRRFMLRPTHARRIREGRLQDQYLRRFDLRGDKLATIAAIDAVGDEARAFDPAFGCDKNGQNDLPVSFGAPHLRLRGITLVPMKAPRSRR
ncbi:TldD/PmbA family protein [Paraliomyxa miuraensis]|uniref:TldD/PmbA family protein n=1 Tax=Paraliomyxa miuraensis TaxID=376150 RepID=UPI0022587674|nr:TldD/PmbA family protein [Paraliomyxa miuraensis]MCX4245099.1 TldD/PmbA family protein [Paraliomyxa miuraensis]